MSSRSRSNSLVPAHIAKVAVAFALIAGTAFVGRPARAADSGTWHMVAGTISLHEPGDTGARIWFDGHLRREPGRFVGIARPGIGWDFGGGLSAWFGYSYVPVWKSATGWAAGQDIWQQLMWTGKVAGAPLAVRGRIEERIASGAEGVSLRGRLFVRTAFNLRGPLALVLFDEVFVELADVAWSARGLRENRIFVGPALLAKGWRAELGYMHILRPEAGIEHQHTVLGSVFFSL